MTDSTDSKVEGSTAPGFEPVAEEFGRLLARERDARGQFCGYLRGERVVDLWAGPDVAADDLQGVYSSTKGVSGICIALLFQRGALDLDAPVSRYWPEFADGGKGDVTVRLALSHQAGIPGVEPQLTLEEVIDHDGAAARLAAQVPHWRPGKAHGYHGLTIGTIMDELVRRVAGGPSRSSSGKRSATRAASTSTSARPRTLTTGCACCSPSIPHPSRRRWRTNRPRPTASPA